MTLEQLLQSTPVNDEATHKLIYERGLKIDESKYAQMVLDFMSDNEAILQRFQCNAYSNYIEITIPSRDEMHAIRGSFGAGNWERNLRYGSMYYSRMIHGVNVLLVCGELPPSCHIEEEEVLQPAQEARMIKVKKLVCSGETKEETVQDEVQLWATTSNKR